MARQLTRKQAVYSADGTLIQKEESLASFHTRQVEARQDAANRMRESRNNKLATIGDQIQQIYRLMLLLWSEAIATETLVKDVVFGTFTLNTSAIMSIIDEASRLTAIANVIRTPKQSQIVTDLLSAQLLGFKPVSSRVPCLIDSSIDRVRLDAINPKRYHSPVRSGLTGRLAWDIIGATLAPQHGTVIDTPRYWYDCFAYQTIKRLAPYTFDYPITERYSKQVMTLGQLWESEFGYYAPIAIVTLDRSSHIGVKCNGRVSTGMERYRTTGYVSSEARKDNFNAPSVGYHQSVECLDYFANAATNDRYWRAKKYSKLDVQSSMTPQAWIVDHTSVPDIRRKGVPTLARRYRGLTVYAHERGALHIRAIGA